MTHTQTSTAPYRYPERWTAANRYGNTLRTRPESRYAFAYLGWMRGGAIGTAPERGRLTIARATEIREHIHSLNLWGDAGS